MHAGAGFPLRRFNLDISQGACVCGRVRCHLHQADSVEEFQSELEAFASHLVLENQQLQHENKQLNGLLKEYEVTLEKVMTKFRGIAVGIAWSWEQEGCRADK